MNCNIIDSYHEESINTNYRKIVGCELPPGTWNDKDDELGWATFASKSLQTTLVAGEYKDEDRNMKVPS